MTIGTTRTALITGASRGLGLALARRLSTEGWQLIIDARGAEALETASISLTHQTRVIAIPGDVTDATHRYALAQAAQELGGLDALVNNASMLGPSPQPELLDYPLEVLEQVYRTNVIAPLALVQTLRNELKSGACVINITSDAGVEAYEGWGGYGSSKAALASLTKTTAIHCAQKGYNIRVNSIHPGPHETKMMLDGEAIFLHFQQARAEVDRVRIRQRPAKARLRGREDRPDARRFFDLEPADAAKVFESAILEVGSK